MTTAPHITKETFIKILQEKGLAKDDDLRIFQTVYALDEQEASATQIAELCEWSDKAVVNGKIAGLGIRILKKYDIQQRERKDGTKSYWDFFFTAYDKENFFIYKLKPELKEALEECGLTKNTNHNEAYLFLWNPDKWEWSNINDDLETIKEKGSMTTWWKCSNLGIKIGDRAFLKKVGEPPNGIMGSGIVVSEPYDKEEDGEKIKVVDIEFDILLDFNTRELLKTENHFNGRLDGFYRQSSGTKIESEYRHELEKLWFEFLITHERNPFSATEEAKEVSRIYREGRGSEVTQTRYERNAYAREACLKEHGYSCLVCDFNFEKVYGEIGKNYIHVHHLNPLAMQKGEYKVDPLTDLVPVCPNCHSMLHKKNPPWEIEELKEKMKNPHRQ